MPREGLTSKQQRFVDEYLVDLNATQAAIRAGYSERTAQQIGSENLLKPVVSEAITAALKKRSEQTGITADSVLKELALIGFSDPTQYNIDSETGELSVDTEAHPHAWRAVSSVKRKVRRITSDTSEITEIDSEFKLWNKVEALKLLGQHLGMFKEPDTDKSVREITLVEVARDRIRVTVGSETTSRQP